MKIALFVGSFPLLSETFILNQVTGLIDRGHSVHIYANTIADQDVVHDDVHRYRLLDNTFHQGNAYASMPRSLPARVVKAAGLFLKHVRKHPRVVFNTLNVWQYGRDALSLNLFYAAHPFLDAGDAYDVFHCHFGHHGHMAALLKAVGAIDARVVTTFHGYDISSVVRLRGAGEYDFLFRTGDLFLPISETWKRELVTLGCDPARIRVHRMGIDPRRFVPDRTQRHAAPHILSIGRLVEKKGFTFALSAVAGLLEHVPDITYAIVGDGPLRSELEHQVASLGLADRVRLLGWKRQDEVVELMREADIFLAPSVTDTRGNKEGIPVVIMEAMAQGLPVVSTQHSGIPELVQDGATGFLVPERDVNTLRERLEQLIGSPELRMALGDRGRAFIEEHHHIDKLNDALVDLFHQLVTGPASTQKRQGSESP